MCAADLHDVALVIVTAVDGDDGHQSSQPLVCAGFAESCYAVGAVIGVLAGHVAGCRCVQRAVCFEIVLCAACSVCAAVGVGVAAVADFVAGFAVAGFVAGFLGGMLVRGDAFWW